MEYVNYSCYLGDTVVGERGAKKLNEPEQDVPGKSSRNWHPYSQH